MRNNHSPFESIAEESEVKELTEQIIQLSIRRASILENRKQQEQASERSNVELPDVSSVNEYPEVTESPQRVERPSHAKPSFVPHQLHSRVDCERRPARKETLYRGAHIQEKGPQKYASARQRRSDCNQHHRPPATPIQVRARVQREQYTPKSQEKLARIQQQQRRRRGYTDKRVPVLDYYRNQIFIGDKVRARTEGSSHTDIGIVCRFNKDYSRVFFLDFRGVQQQRAPHNLIIDTD